MLDVLDDLVGGKVMLTAIVALDSIRAISL